jgi:hypothetical protein
LVLLLHVLARAHSALRGQVLQYCGRWQQLLRCWPCESCTVRVPLLLLV